MKFSEFMRKQLSEDNGNPSSSRINTFITLITLIGTYITLTYTICFYHPEHIPMLLETTAVTIGGIIGLRIIAKTKEQKMDGIGINSTTDASAKPDSPTQ